MTFKPLHPVKLIKLTIKLSLYILLLFLNNTARAVPGFARQTGMSCMACHSVFPELTSFGRQFKLDGYTLTGMKTIESRSDSGKITMLKMLTTMPFSVMIQTSATHISKDLEGTQNNSVALPQQLSMFFAGEVTPHIGTFMQVTYDGEGFGMDNADIRYANRTNIGETGLAYGINLNNNPTVQDLWNSTPAWGFPFASPDAAPGPAKSTFIQNQGSQVAGLGIYTLINNFLYAEATVYRTAQIGADNPADSSNSMVIKGISPYWRLALQHQWASNYIELGTFGMTANTYLSGISGNRSDFTDVGFDLQYEHQLTIGLFSIHSAFINEAENRDSPLSGEKTTLNFNSFNINGNLYLKNGVGATMGYFATSGTADPLTVASLNNKPNSSGFIFQLQYLPWYNTKFALQYTLYNKFDGGTNNYDGSGRSMTDNNMLYLLTWFNF
ncbi:MAG TPA: hypothetical protein VE912_12780 [Bacteroidales bacterium]|nr:hypothetical protein [Bacteroidales bacterium]